MDKELWDTSDPTELGKALEKIMKMYISRKLFLRKYLNFTLTDIPCTWEYWKSISMRPFLVKDGACDLEGNKVRLSSDLSPVILMQKYRVTYLSYSRICEPWILYPGKLTFMYKRVKLLPASANLENMVAMTSS